MKVLGPESAEITIFTFKEGLLSAVAHDLKLRVEQFEIRVDGDPANGPGGVDAIIATADPSSLSVVCARKNGRDEPRTLGARDKRKIVKYIANDVLHPRRHSEIRFESRDVSGESITGQLTLHGQTRPIRWTLSEDRGVFRAEARIHQPHFDVKPFTAMLGALAIKPDVIIEVRVKT